MLGPQVTREQQDLLDAAAPLVQERMTTLGEAVDMLGFLFVSDGAFRVDPDDAKKLLDAEGRAIVLASYHALADLAEWDTASIEATLRTILIDGLGLKPRNAFGPGAGCRDRPADIATALRVDGAPRPRAVPRASPHGRRGPRLAHEDSRAA